MQMHIQGKKIIHSIEQGGITCPPNFFQSEQADDPKAVKNTRRTDKICSAAFTKSVFPSHQDEEKKIFFLIAFAQIENLIKLVNSYMNENTLEQLDKTLHEPFQKSLLQSTRS